MKICSTCGEVKGPEQFYRDRAFKDGLASQCKGCKNKKTAVWRDKKREEYNAYAREYRKTHPSKYATERRRSLKNRYDLTPEQYDEMLKGQGGTCAMCSATPGKYPLYVDHCHKSGKVRGLLCASHNRSMALLDDEALLAKAIEYKKKSA